MKVETYLKGAKEDLKEPVERGKACQASSSILLGNTSGRPLQQLGKDRAECSVIELVDHLNRDLVDDILDLVHIRQFERGLGIQ